MFEYDKPLNHVSYLGIPERPGRPPTGQTHEITLSPHLAAVLGFPDDHVTFARERDLTAGMADPYAGYKYICVYSEIVEDSYVGDTLAPVLCIVPITAHSKSSLLTYEPIHPQYIKVTRKLIP